jgi:hypothetical protein
MDMAFVCLFSSFYFTTRCVFMPLFFLLLAATGVCFYPGHMDDDTQIPSPFFGLSTPVDGDHNVVTTRLPERLPSHTHDE